MKITKKISPAALAGMAAVIVSSQAHAASLGLSNTTPPDIQAPNVTVTYNHTTQAFSAIDNSLATFSVDTDGVAGANYYIKNGTFTVTAQIDNSGVLSPGGTVTISGSKLVDSSMALVSLLPTLTGTLTAFGFPDAPGGNIFEFKFTSAAGTLTGSPISFPLDGGIIINAVGSGFDGRFGQDFRTADSAGTADTFAQGASVPTPAAFSGGLLALGALAIRRGRQLISRH